MIPPPAAFRRTEAPDGTPIAFHHEPASGSAPTFVFAHATGFCGAVWAPVVPLVRELAPGAGICVVDQRSHGGSGTSPHPFDWWDIGRDLLTVMLAAEIGSRVVGVGHSGGGAGVGLAELLAPGTFEAILLVEPIFLPPPHVRQPDHPLALAAERRRRWFASRDAAHRRWVERRPFASWDPGAFEGYLAHGLVPGPDPETGEPGVVLACAPEDEAEWFRAGDEHGGWDRLAELAPRSLVMAGAGSDTHAGGLADAIASRMPNAAVRIIDETDHFLPMQRPDLVAGAAVELSR